MTCARTAYSTLVRAWETLQVELHGQYSLPRLHALHDYTERTSIARVCAVVLATPIPCLVAVAIADSIPMEPPNRGLEQASGFWIRCVFATVIYSHAILSQICYYVPQLTMSLYEQLAVSVSNSLITCAATYALACAIGFPVPFTIPMTSPVWTLGFVGCAALARGRFLYHHRDVCSALLKYSLALVCQMSMVIVYPLFFTLFSQLSSMSQTLFALVLPVIKVAEKYVLSKVVVDNDDVKPEIVIFNVEVFNALFVSCCMQSSTSITTSLVIIAADLLQACASIYDLSKMLVELDALADKMGMDKGQLVETAIDILRDYPQTARHRSLSSMLASDAVRMLSSNASPVKVAPLPAAACDRAEPVVIRPASSTSRSKQQHAVQGKARTIKAASARLAMQIVQPNMPQTPPHVLSMSTHMHRQSNGTATTSTTSVFRESSKLSSRLPKRSIAAVLSANERLVFVQKGLKVLYLTEFLLLVEFTEVMIPVVYSVYLVVLFHLPNRAYYPQLRSMDETQLHATIQSVLLYAAMELVSFLGLYVILRQKLHLSGIRQLAFVLDKQATMVQSKLILWVVFMLQSTLLHLGADYSFQFTWLRSSSPPA